MKEKNNIFFFICKSFKHMLQSLEGIKFFKTFKITQKIIIIIIFFTVIAVFHVLLAIADIFYFYKVTFVFWLYRSQIWTLYSTYVLLK